MTFGSYRLVAPLGRGGMGEVWRAQHRTLERSAAIKLIRADQGGDEEHARRFHREAQAIAALKSAHTVQLYDFGATDDGTLYLVMELLDGLNLEELTERCGPADAAGGAHPGTSL